MPRKQQRPSIKRKLLTFLTLTGFACTGLIFFSHTLLIDYIHDELHRQQLEAAANRLSKMLTNDKEEITKSSLRNFSLSQYSVHIEDSQGRSFTSENIKPKLQVVESFRKPGIFHISDDDRSILGYYRIFNNRQDKLSVTIIEKSSYSPNTLDKIHVLIWIISFTILVTISLIIFIGVTIALLIRNKVSEHYPEI